jgi:hypothetical protein
MAVVLNSLDLSYAVVSARRQRSPDGPFPAARDEIFGTAFAISEDLFLTAGHVVQAAAAVGHVALGHLTMPVENCRYDVATDSEVFEEVDLALIRCPDFNPVIHQVLFDPLAIFQEVRALGFALGLDPEFHNYVHRGFIGHVVSGSQLFGWRSQPLAYELSFVPPKGLSGAALVPDGYGGTVASGIIVGSRRVQIDDDSTQLGIAIAAQELLRLESRMAGGSLASLFGRARLPARKLIGTVTQRLAEMASPNADHCPNVDAKT